MHQPMMHNALKRLERRPKPRRIRFSSWGEAPLQALQTALRQCVYQANDGIRGLIIAVMVACKWTESKLQPLLGFRITQA